MAVYNGERYLEPQIRSILEQLGPDGDVVVVDDASQDGSPELLARFAGPRFRVYRNEKNLGVLASFEKALRLAQGDVLFLSDQDDLWLPGKVGKILAAFDADPELTLIATDATLIDGDGNLIADSFFARRGRFRPGVFHNLIKNKYLGCTLAFRRSMLRYFLPIPTDVPMHDIWFGLVNQLCGKTGYLDEPLIAYRRHGANASPSKSAPFFQQVCWRWQLLKNIFLHCKICRRADGESTDE